MADCKRKTANLFSDKLIGMTWWDGVITADERFTLHIAEVKPNTEYTASGNNSVDNIMVTYYSVYPAEGQSSVESVRYVYPTNPTRSVATFTTPDDSRIKYAAVRFGSDATEVMFNLGSTAFPYEPYGWVHSLRKLSTDTDTITTLPAVIYPNDTTATVGLKGNMQQTGTPSPDNPIMPQGCGERTGNLFASIWEQGSINGTTGQNEVAGTLVRTKDYIPIKPNIPYSFSRNIANGYMNLRLYRADKSYIGSGSASTIRLISGTSTGNPMGTRATFCCFEVIDSEAAYIRFNDSSNNTATKWHMVEGEYTEQTMPEYQPYGYKLDISSASTTTPIYLGEVESTRRIKKLVLDGTEDWDVETQTNFFMNIIAGALKNKTVVCTHQLSTSTLAQGENCFISTSGRFNFTTSTIEHTAEAFKAYLAQQYAAGTPVTVWYVLATPETAVVNEPLMKIGDYADTLSNVSIPVNAGGDTISVDTTLQPSEVTVNYKGWHPVQSAHKKSAQLIPEIVQGGVSTTDGSFTNSSSRVRTNYIPVESGKTYAVSSGNLYLATGCYYNNGIFSSKIDEVVGVTTSATFTVPSNVNQIAIGFRTANGTTDITPSDLQNYMLNTGSTALPYEPYWK